ncbi:MAG TPA: AzlC family ABC transporter permease [Thermoleophilaceae bacterium]
MRGVFLHTAVSVLASVADETGQAESRREAGRARETAAGAPRREVRPSPRGGRYRDGVRAVAPLVPAVLAFGISFGVLARAAGFPGAASLVMSATTFAGSAQFAVVSVLGAGGTAAAAIGAAVLLNARYGPMGLAAAHVFEGGRLRRFLESQLLVDESWALSNRGGRFDRHVLVGAGALLYVGWVGGSAIGVAAGDRLGDPATLGLDAAFPALFLALLATQLHSRHAVLAALTGGAIALVLVPLTPAGVPVIAATAGCLVGLTRPARATERRRAPRAAAVARETSS